jgi:hypothetical protein
MSYEEIASRFGLKSDSIRRMIQRESRESLQKTSPRNFDKNPDATLRGAGERFTLNEFHAGAALSLNNYSNRETGIPQNAYVPQNLVMQVQSQNALVIGDLHVPYHNRTMLGRALNVCEQYFPHVTDLIIGGDIYDFSALSQHPHNQTEADTESTVKLAGDVLRAITQPFERCFIVNGNHDERVAKKLDANWGLELLINASFGRDWPDCTVYISNLDYLYLNDTWLIGHPSHYSGQGGKTPSDLADLHARNVITFHNHVIGWSQSKSGRFVGIDAGHCTVPDYHYYQKRRLTKFARWSSGFVIISNNHFYTFSEQHTDWGLYDNL